MTSGAEYPESEFVAKEPCPACGSRDNLARYTDGHAHCFTPGCEYREPADGQKAAAAPQKVPSEFLRGQPKALGKRKINEETCRKYSYWVGEDSKGRTVQIANYRRDGQIVGQKLRRPGKKFSFLGNSKESGLFGQHLWQPGRRLVITEGEIDALAVAQVFNLKWPVVSIPSGAGGATRAIKRELEWVNGFDEVVIMFDMDDAGQDAALEVAALLTPGKARIAQLPRKDAGELLEHDEGERIVTAVYEAQTKRPDGVITFGSLKERALSPVEVGLPWHDPRLTELTYGKRYGEVYTFGAGTGIGKTDWLMEEAAFIAESAGEKVGLFFLEQQPVETAKRLAGKVAGRRFHVPDESWTQDELVTAFDILDQGQVFIYDHFGTTDWEVIEAKMGHMVVAEGVKHIFLDNLTSFAAGADDERKTLEDTMAKIAQFAQRHLVCVYLVSHLATPEGKPHEEGGRVMLRHFKGSRAIGFWTHFAFGLERNTQAENEAERNTTTFRVLKDRFTGQSNGHTLYYQYDHETGRLAPTDEPETDVEHFPDDDDDAPF